MGRRLLVNTDLDATLLDHDTYSWLPAQEALEQLCEHACPVVLNSSKTLAEMRELSLELSLNHPLVCENGAMMAFPKAMLEVESVLDFFGKSSLSDEGDYWVKYIGASREQAVEVIHALREMNPAFAFKGYADWSVEEVAEKTDLPMEKAALSKQRLGTEPLIWSGSEAAFVDFEKEVVSRGLQVLKGGRFFHVSGKSDKAVGLIELMKLYRHLDKESDWISVALGDSPNDEKMLSAAHIAVVIPNQAKLKPTAPEVIFAEVEGPAGWNKSMKYIVQQQLNPF